jgi:hypothetical protein
MAEANGKAWGTSEARQMLELAGEQGRGGVYLRLTPALYARRKRPELAGGRLRSPARLLPTLPKNQPVICHCPVVQRVQQANSATRLEAKTAFGIRPGRSRRGPSG